MRCLILDFNEPLGCTPSASIHLLERGSKRVRDLEKREKEGWLLIPKCDQRRLQCGSHAADERKARICSARCARLY